MPTQFLKRGSGAHLLIWKDIMGSALERGVFDLSLAKTALARFEIWIEAL